MKASILNLRPIYQFVRLNRAFYTNGDANANLTQEFYKVCHNLTKSIPERPGFYLWGSYGRYSSWTSIYLGKAGFGKTACLRARIDETLRDEKCCFWRMHFSEDYFLRTGKRRGNSSYLNRRRSVLKAGATHIVWIATPRFSNTQIPLIEADLIEALNPTANILRPRPPDSMQHTTEKIFHCIRELIHGHRAEQFSVSVR